MNSDLSDNVRATYISSPEKEIELLKGEVQYWKDLEYQGRITILNQMKEIRELKERL